MLNFQNTICWKTQNTVSHKVKQSQKRHYKPQVQHQPANISTHPATISTRTENSQ